MHRQRHRAHSAPDDGGRLRRHWYRLSPTMARRPQPDIAATLRLVTRANVPTGQLLFRQAGTPNPPSTSRIPSSAPGMTAAWHRLHLGSDHAPVGQIARTPSAPLILVPLRAMMQAETSNIHPRTLRSSGCLGDPERMTTWWTRKQPRISTMEASTWFIISGAPRTTS
jgi:hypothetical protein